MEIEEAAIIGCLRSLIPFSDLVETMASQLKFYPKPQMVGYMLEYLVGYALVADLNPMVKSKIKTSTGSMIEYITTSPENEIFFPDHCCGPDIIYKYKNTLYMVQVKFVDKISKQERVNACHTTNPNLFYWNKKQQCVLKGFEKKRETALLAMEKYTQKRLVFLHTNTKTTDGMQGTELINEEKRPDFFKQTGLDLWKLLNGIRQNFNQK